jgi:flagellar protein FliO/FliZ
MTEILALFAVALLAAAGVWLFARTARPGFANSPLLRVIAAVHVGPRERVVIVEAGEVWLVLGVAPGRVNAIHTLARDAAAPLAPQRPFADWLRKLTEKNGAR